MLLRVVKVTRRGTTESHNAWWFLTTTYVIPPARSRMGGVVFRIGLLGFVAAGAQPEKEERSLESSGSGQLAHSQRRRSLV